MLVLSLPSTCRELSAAHEQLATAEAQAEEAERRAQASQQAAACGVARLTHVTVGMAADEDNNTDMIDPELRLHWCDDDYERKLADTKTPHELRALLVGIASTVEHLLNSGAARRDQMAEQVAALSAEVERMGSGAADVAAAKDEAAAVRKELERQGRLSMHRLSQTIFISGNGRTNFEQSLDIGHMIACLGLVLMMH